MWNSDNFFSSNKFVDLANYFTNSHSCIIRAAENGFLRFLSFASLHIKKWNEMRILCCLFEILFSRAQLSSKKIPAEEEWTWKETELARQGNFCCIVASKISKNLLLEIIHSWQVKVLFDLLTNNAAVRSKEMNCHNLLALAIWLNVWAAWTNQQWFSFTHETNDRRNLTFFLQRLKFGKTCRQR